MEARGGNGYIEEWVNARLVRDAQIGLLWEGTSNINALDVIGRAVGRTKAHNALETLLRERLKAIMELPSAFTSRLDTALEQAISYADRVARDATLEAEARRASSALYHAASAILLAWEGSRPGGDARRALISRFVLEHRLSSTDPLKALGAKWERPAIAKLLEGAIVSAGEASALLEV
jgi:hypothetical protein